ncbi:MAG TPA: hypothetical protein VN408_05485 [Actinoplanes sp.]|nr:hypothetical protein [Actinoplanes sp.]
MLLGMVTLPAAPALAAEVGCTFTGSNISCSTATLPNATTKITIQVTGVKIGDKAATLTCRAYDQGGTQRASASNPAGRGTVISPHTVPSSKYFLVCIRPSGSTGGSGRIADS